jgi:hypothetical protein
MPVRMRVTVTPTGDRVGELQTAEEVRADLWVHAPVEVDPKYPLVGTHRDEAGRAYLEFVTEVPAEVRRVIAQGRNANRVALAENPSLPGQECLNCGNVAGPVQPSVCPNCGFRDIAPCPVCGEEVPRQLYSRVSGNLFRCPRCRNAVRFRFNSPMFLPNGDYNQPVVVVEEATVAHEIR